MCMPGIERPTSAQMAGFGGGGTGINVTGYTPDYGPFNEVAKYFPSKPGTAPNSAAMSVLPDKGGTFSLSNGDVVKSQDLIDNNQKNAYGASFGVAGLDRGPTANSFVGQELTLPQSPEAPVAAPAPAPVAQQESLGASGQTNVQAFAPKNTTVQEASASERRRRRMRSTADKTLVTGGQGLFGTTSDGSKQLYGA